MKTLADAVAKIVDREAPGHTGAMNEGEAAFVAALFAVDRAAVNAAILAERYARHVKAMTNSVRRYEMRLY